MRSASVVQLLKVGRYLYEKQTMFKKLTGVKFDLFKDEISSIKQVILIYMGIISGMDKSLVIVDTDHYDYVTNMFWNFCREQISEEEMMDLIHVLKVDQVQVIKENGEFINSIISVDSLPILLEIKKLLEGKRNKVNQFIESLSDYITTEMKWVHRSLEEIGENRI